MSAPDTTRRAIDRDLAEILDGLIGQYERANERGKAALITRLKCHFPELSHPLTRAAPSARRVGLLIGLRVVDGDG